MTEKKNEVYLVHNWHNEREQTIAESLGLREDWTTMGQFLESKLPSRCRFSIKLEVIEYDES